MRRFPNHAITTALVKLISENSQIRITDHVDADIELPYAVVGDINTSDSETKDERITNSSIQVDIYSDYMGRKEIDTIAEEIAKILQSEETCIDLTKDGFQCVGGDIESFETYEEDAFGYIGTITMHLIIQDLG